MSIPATANDSISSVTPAGIRFVKTDAIRMKKEVLSISPEKVQVDYEFYNDSDTALTLPVSFPMPPIGKGMYDNEYTFPDFTVTVDGEEKSYETTRSALMEMENDRRLSSQEAKPSYTEKDVTAGIKAAGLPLDTFVEAEKLPAHQLKKLMKLGYYAEEDGIQPAYFLRTVYSWEQEFPPHETVHISHSYSPKLGGNSIGAPNFLGYGEGYGLGDYLLGCYARPDFMSDSSAFGSDDAAYKKNKQCVAQMKAQGMIPGKYSAAHMKYILSTGANWKHGIEDFTLHIDGAAVVFARVEGTAKVGVGSIDIHKNDFHPKKELEVEFIGIGQPAKLPPFMDLSKVK